MTNYQSAKNELKSISQDAKKEFKNDKPAQRMIINDTADALCKNLNLSDYNRNLLSNYACKLHPKN
jgi:hypothetical protein